MAGLVTSVTVTPSGMSRSIAVAATFASLWTRSSYFCTAPVFDWSGDTVTCADKDVTTDAASSRTTESFIRILCAPLRELCDIVHRRRRWSRHLVTGHRLRHPHVPHPSHRSRGRSQPEEYVK